MTIGLILSVVNWSLKRDADALCTVLIMDVYDEVREHDVDHTTIVESDEYGRIKLKGIWGTPRELIAIKKRELIR